MPSEDACMPDPHARTGAGQGEEVSLGQVRVPMRTTLTVLSARRRPGCTMAFTRYRLPAPETIALPCWAPGFASLCRPSNMAQKSSLHYRSDPTSRREQITTNCITRERKMKRETGLRDFPIWLIGDSSPVKWEAHLDEPLDSRHPARHNIWTPILEGIQSHLFSWKRKRLQTDALYTRNAVHHAYEKPGYRAVEWSSHLDDETHEMAGLLKHHTPMLVLSFGSFAFEFARRSLDERPHCAPNYWTTIRLGNEFRQRIQAFRPYDVNLLPLLHASIARGHFLKSHNYFTDIEGGNYFDYVARKIAGCLCNYESEFFL